MPSLNVFAVCERVIIDAKGIPSLINLFQRLDLQLPSGDPPPENAVVPGRWVVFCLWQLTSEELGKNFIQRTKIINPDGSTFNESFQPFRDDSEIDLQIRTYIDFNGVPIGRAGQIKILVWLDGEEDKVHSTYFFVNHLPKIEPPTEAVVQH